MFFSPDSPESAAWLQGEHAGHHGPDSLSVHGGARDGSADEGISASLQQQHELWGKAGLDCSAGLEAEITQGLEQKPLQIPCGYLWDFCAWSACEVCSVLLGKADVR